MQIEKKKALYIAVDVLEIMHKAYAIEPKYADKKVWLEPDEFNRIFLHRFNDKLNNELEKKN